MVIELDDYAKPKDANLYAKESKLKIQNELELKTKESEMRIRSELELKAKDAEIRFQKYLELKIQKEQKELDLLEKEKLAELKQRKIRMQHEHEIE